MLGSITPDSQLMGMRRRAYIASVASTATVACATVALAGCNALAPQTRESESPSGTGDSADTSDGGSDEQTTWTSTANCDPMKENVIKAKWVKDDLADAYSPIHFSDLTPGEQEILRVVVEEGGFANCEVTDAFRRFVERVIEHRREQDREYVWLEYQGTYYGLYVQQGDQVFT